MATKKQEEFINLLITWGIPIHIAAELATKGRLTQFEIKTAIKILKYVIPVTGRILATEVVGGLTTGALLGRTLVKGATLGAAGAVGRNPWSVAAILLTLGYIKREELAEVGAAIADDPRTQAAYEQLIESGTAGKEFMREPAQLLGAPGIRPLAKARERFVKRKVSKANRAVKEGMRLLKAGGKALSGSTAGTLPKAAFRIAVKAAGMANPKTKSKPGKGKSIMNKLARRLKKWW